jgi:tetratricopeptide (TPR) repeat protein
MPQFEIPVRRVGRNTGYFAAIPPAKDLHNGDAAPGLWRYSEANPMRARLLVLSFLTVSLLGVAAPALADRRDDAKAQVEFGWEVAMKGLWNEALYRWLKATEIDPTYGAAWNNLAIAYEHQGKFVEARKAYEKALELEPNNNFIRQNYDLFREIYDRQNIRRTP